MNEPQRVKDGSQPLKIALFILFMLGSAAFAFRVLDLLEEIVKNTA